MQLAATWMQLETIILSEVSQKEEDSTYTWNLKYGTNEQKQTYRHREQTCGC